MQIPEPASILGYKTCIFCLVLSCRLCNFAFCYSVVLEMSVAKTSNLLGYSNSIKKIKYNTIFVDR